MSRISIDVTAQEHQMLKAKAALKGKSIKEYVLERTLGNEERNEESALAELEALLDERRNAAEAGAISTRTVGEIFELAYVEENGGRNA